MGRAGGGSAAGGVDSVAPFGSTRSLGGPFRDQSASADRVITNRAMATANEILNTRGEPGLATCARSHTLMTSGAPRSSASFSSRNSAWILFSFPADSIVKFLSIQRLAQMLFPSFVMLTGTADRDAHHIRGFAQAQIFVKPQVQHFSLARRQTFESDLKLLPRFGSFECCRRFCRARVSLRRGFRSGY